MDIINYQFFGYSARQNITRQKSYIKFEANGQQTELRQVFILFGIVALFFIGFCIKIVLGPMQELKFVELYENDNYENCRPRLSSFELVKAKKILSNMSLIIFYFIYN